MNAIAAAETDRRGEGLRRLRAEPYYLPAGDEVDLFERAQNAVDRRRAAIPGHETMNLGEVKGHLSAGRRRGNADASSRALEHVL